MTAQQLSAEAGGEWLEWYEEGGPQGYFFCRDGRAGKIHRGKVRLLIGCSAGIGYRAVTMVGPWGHKSVYIHRAVCMLFNGAAPDGKNVVRHLDCNMKNNAAANLAWGSPYDNAQDGKRNGKNPAGERNPMARLDQSSVDAIRKERAVGLTLKQLAKRHGVSIMTIQRAVTGASWK